MTGLCHYSITLFSVALHLHKFVQAVNHDIIKCRAILCVYQLILQ